MFFYATERFHKSSIYATVAYIIIYGYLKEKYSSVFWTVFIVDVLLTYHKDTIMKQIDHWRGINPKKNEDKRTEKEQQPELKTTKSGYFDTDFMSDSDTSLVEQMIKDSKSL
jgi:hypothetical protein